MKIIFISILLVLMPSVLAAKTVVFIHGYMEDGMVWRNKGVTTALLADQYVDQGTLVLKNKGIQRFSSTQSTTFAPNVFYTIELPWQMSIVQQATILSHYLATIYQHRKETITLVGHSNGGLVARYALVNQIPLAKIVNTLISIATPHLGSPLAQLAILANKTPLDELSQVLVDQILGKSTPLFRQLRAAKPNSFLYWLNQKPHPNMAYISIIRKNESLLPSKLDYVVPAYSQNMNNVFALRGKSTVYASNQSHALSHNDGELIAYIMRSIN